MSEVTQADITAAQLYADMYSESAAYRIEHHERWAKAFAAHRIATEQRVLAEVAAWLRNLAGYPASALEGQPPQGEVWVLHRSADAIETGAWKQ